MYRIRTEEIEVSGAHCLDLPYTSPCSKVHGHNWSISVEVRGSTLNKEGMLIDFSIIKRIIHKLDHNNINEVVNFNPTAENIAKWVADEIDKEIKNQWKGDEDMPGPPRPFSTLCHPFVYEVVVQETKGNKAIWQKS